MIAKDYITQQRLSVSMAGLSDDLWSGLKARVPSFLSNMQQIGKLAIGVVSENEPKILVKYLPERNYAILIHEDLANLIYRITRAAIAQMSVIGVGVEHLAQVDEVHFVQLLTDILWWFQKTGTVFGPDYPVNEHQKLLAGVLAVETERFLVAHEFGHIVVNPGGEIDSNDLIERLLSASFRGFISDNTSQWEEEHIADILGFDIVMGLMVGNGMSDNGFENQLRYAGVELMLLIEYAMEELGFRVSNTHPPAKMRLEVIRRRALAISSSEHDYNCLAGVARKLEQFFTDALHRYFNADHSFYQAKGKLLLSKILYALEVGSSSTTPGYYIFYESMNEVLSAGYYESTINLIEKLLRELTPPDPQPVLLYEFQEMTGTILDEEKRAKLRNFRKYKLLVGYFARQANPMGFYMMLKIESFRNA